MRKKNELTIRERRKIYEDSICVIKQTQKMCDTSPAAASGRAMRNLMEKQIDKCSSIIFTVLGYHEATKNNDDGTISNILVPSDDDPSYIIDKKRFDKNIVPNLPKDKDLRESLCRRLCCLW